MTGYVIQSAQATATSSPGTVTLPAATRAGNSLVALASVRNVTSNASLSSVTLAGVADNFGQALAVTGSAANLYWWLDPLCAGGQTHVVFTTTGGTGAEALTMDVLEVGGMIPLPAGAGAVDVSSGTTGTGTVWTSGTTGTAGWPTEIQAGLAAASGTHTTAPQGWPWVNLTAQPNGTASITQAAYALTSAPSSSIGEAAYGGTFSASQAWTAGLATFPCMPFSPALPDYMAGSGPQQGDMNTLVTLPLGFCQQRVVFRAAQLTTTTTLSAGQPGPFALMNYDTIYEDPYQGWFAGGPSWSAPYTGWYMISQTFTLGTCAVDTVLWSGNVQGGLVMPAAGGGVVQSVTPLFLPAEYQLGFDVRITGATSAQTSNSPGSTVEIVWMGFSAG